jgi:hypothetical protein
MTNTFFVEHFRFNKFEMFYQLFDGIVTASVIYDYYFVFGVLQPEQRFHGLDDIARLVISRDKDTNRFVYP